MAGLVLSIPHAAIGGRQSFSFINSQPGAVRGIGIRPEIKNHPGRKEELRGCTAGSVLGPNSNGWFFLFNL